MNGDIQLTSGAETAIVAVPEKAEVVKATTFTQTAPEGFAWVDNGDGTSTLAEIDADDGYNLTIAEKIDVNFAIDVDAYDAEGGKIVVNGVNADIESNEKSDKTYSINSLPTVAGGPYDGNSIVTLDVAPAQIAETFTIEIYDADNNLRDTISASVYDYANAMKEDAVYGDLMQSLINYGALAAEYFDYEGAAITASDSYKDALSDEERDTLISRRYATLDNGYSTFDGMVYFAKVEPEFKLYFIDTHADEAFLGESCDGLSVALTGLENGVAVKVSGFKASDFGKTFSVTVDGTTLTINGYAYIASALKDADLSNLATGLFRYAQAAEALSN